MLFIFFSIYTPAFILKNKYFYRKNMKREMALVVVVGESETLLNDFSGTKPYIFVGRNVKKKLSLLPIFSLFPFYFNFISTDKLFKRIRLSIAVSFLKSTTSQEPTTKRDETRQTLQTTLHTYFLSTHF